VWGNIFGYRRTGKFFGLTRAIAFICEYASTRIGIPYAGRAVVGFLSHFWYRWMEPGRNATDPISREVVKWELLLGIGL